MDLGSGIASFGANMADAMQEYHKRHVAYDQQMKIAEALSNIGYTPDGRLTNIAQAGESGQKAKPIIDPKFMEQFRTTKQSEWDKNTGALQMANRLGLNLLQHQAASAIQDASLSGQRTQQIMQQSAQSFPAEQENLKQRTAHLKKITDEEGKINVPGFGMMTPPQFSAHTARMERMEVLKKKSEPILTFENALQTKYGLGIQDIVDASKPQEFTDPRGTKYKGTPFYNATGDLVSSKEALKNPDGTFVHVGANQIPVPLFDKKGGLGWTQIAGKAKQFSGKLEGLQNDQTKLQQESQRHQAEQIMSAAKTKDAATLATPEWQKAVSWAQGIIGQ